MPRYTETTHEVVDVSELKDFAKRLRDQAPELNRRLRSELRKSADPMADYIRAHSFHNSRVPASVKTHVSGLSVTVTAGGPAAPEAKSMSGGTRGAGWFRHPVIGTGQRVWVRQRSFPFMKRAAEVEGPKARKRILAALDNTLDRVARGQTGRKL